MTCLATHHDFITGTAPEETVQDYKEIIQDATQDSLPSYSAFIEQLAREQGLVFDENHSQFAYCLVNGAVGDIKCPAFDKELVLAIYNPSLATKTSFEFKIDKNKQVTKWNPAT